MTQLTSSQKFVTRAVVASVVLIAGLSLAQAQTTGSEASEEETPSTKELHRGIIPLKDYGGDLATRSNLLGDWGGLRSDLAEKGIRFRGWLTPLLQDVVDGGASTGAEFGASVDLWGAVDFDRMGVIPGGLLVTRVESDVGNSTQTTAGTVMAPSFNSVIPVASQPDDDTLSITNLYYTQFFGQKFGTWVGRTDTLHNWAVTKFNA